MNITFGMPELLVILSVVTYPQSLVLSALFFMMGVFGRLLSYGVETKRLEEAKEENMAEE